MTKHGYNSQDCLLHRDELTSERDIDSTYYLYEKGGMLYGHCKEGTWCFGLKDQSRNNGVKLSLTGQGELGVIHKPARTPL